MTRVTLQFSDRSVTYPESVLSLFGTLEDLLEEYDSENLTLPLTEFSSQIFEEAIAFCREPPPELPDPELLAAVNFLYCRSLDTYLTQWRQQLFQYLEAAKNFTSRPSHLTRPSVERVNSYPAFLQEILLIPCTDQTWSWQEQLLLLELGLAFSLVESYFPRSGLDDDFLPFLLQDIEFEDEDWHTAILMLYDFYRGEDYLEGEIARVRRNFPADGGNAELNSHWWRNLSTPLERQTFYCYVIATALHLQSFLSALPPPGSFGTSQLLRVAILAKNDLAFALLAPAFRAQGGKLDQFLPVTVRGSPAAVEEILQAGVDKEKVLAALEPAATVGSLEVVELLLAQGISAEEIRQRVQRTLVPAARRGSLPIVRAFVRTGLTEADIRGPIGMATLRDAAIRGHVQVVNYLLNLGISADDLRSDGYLILLNAIRHGRTAVVRELFGAGLTVSDFHSLMNSLPEWVLVPLASDILKNPEMLDLLLEFGVTREEISTMIGG